MRALALAASCVALALPVVTQQIYDIVRTHLLPLLRPSSHSDAEWQYTTTWDRSSLFTYKNLGSSPINFVTPGAIGTADIVVNDAQVYQTMFGHGGSLSMFFSRVSCFLRCMSGGLTYVCGLVADSSALLLNNMKVRNPLGFLLAR